jgi:hypothetical protein
LHCEFWSTHGCEHLFGEVACGNRQTANAADLVHGSHATPTTKPITLLLPSCCPARLNLHSIVLHNGWVRQLSFCPAARCVAATSLDGARMLTSSRSLNSPGLHRRNNVPQWQRMHQTHDGLRQWQKGPRAKFMLYPYYALLASTSAATMYMMGRMVLVRLHCFVRPDKHNTLLMPHAGSQDLVLQQLNDCLLYITAIELFYAKSKIPTFKAASFHPSLSLRLSSSMPDPLYRALCYCCLHVQNALLSMSLPMSSGPSGPQTPRSTSDERPHSPRDQAQP